MPSFEEVAAVAEEEIVLESDLYRVVLTNVGARVQSWKLKGYHDPEGNDLELIPCVREDDVPMPLRIDLADTALADEINRTAIFRVERSPVAASGDRGAGETITFRWADGRGVEVVKSLTLRDDYLLDLDVSVQVRGRPQPVRIAWGP
mgnify:FL=1